MLTGLSSLNLGGAAPPVSSKADGDAKVSAWEVNLGPLSFGSAGVDLKPQMKIGAKSQNFLLEAGVSDVRDGLKFGIEAEVQIEAKASGHSLEEMHNSIHCNTPGFDKALHNAKSLLAEGTHREIAEKIAPIAEKVGIPPEQLERIFAGEGLTDREPMTLLVKVATGLGWNAKACLGWCDTKGYHMVGAGGQIRLALALAANVFAGRHKSGKSMKIVLGLSNFTFEYTLPLPPKADSVGGVAANKVLLPLPKAVEADTHPHSETTATLDLLGLDIAATTSEADKGRNITKDAGGTAVTTQAQQTQHANLLGLDL